MDNPKTEDDFKHEDDPKYENNPSQEQRANMFAGEAALYKVTMYSCGF